MPRDLFHSSINLDYTYPPFLERLLLLKARCAAKGVRYFSTQQFRTWGESHQLYQAYLQGGPRAAPAGLSDHNYGLASDEALIIKDDPRVLRWNESDFQIMIDEAKALELHSGSGYKDFPHISWPGFVTGQELQPLLRIWKINMGLLLLDRLKKVWDYVDKNGPKLKPVVLTC